LKSLLSKHQYSEPVQSVKVQAVPVNISETSIMQHQADAYQDIRDAIRDLCAQFPAEYFRDIDEKRAYPESFVNALTEAGWLAALIPQEYGGSGLSLTEASVIMEEI